ncbi:hypothetical protein ABEU87_17505 [Bacillus subtilis]
MKKLREVEYINGMNLGLGYNSFTNSVHPSSALDNIDQTRPVVEATGQKVYFQVELLSNSLSLSEQLNVSASAALTYGLTASGSAKTSFAHSFKQNSYTVYVLVRVHVQNQQTLLDLTRAKLSDKAALLYATDIENFNKIYGNCFVCGILSGGDYYGILEIESRSAEEFREIKANLSGKATYGVISGEASGTFEQALKQITSSYKMKATVLRNGSEGELQQITPDQLIKDALSFPAKVLEGKGVPFSVLVLPYDHIPHPAVQHTEIPYAQECLDKLGRIYEKYKKHQNDLQYAIDNQDYFPGIDIPTINKKIDEIQEQILGIQSSAKKHLDDPYNCEIPQVNDKLLENILPKQVTPSKLGRKWLFRLGGWFAVFNRIDETNTFEAEFRMDTVFKSKIEIHVSGKDVFIVRTDIAPSSHRLYNTVYKGTFNEEGNEATGVDIREVSLTWTAKIEN